MLLYRCATTYCPNFVQFHSVDIPSTFFSARVLPMSAADCPVCDRRTKLSQSLADNYLGRNNGYLSNRSIASENIVLQLLYILFQSTVSPLGTWQEMYLPTKDVTGNCFYRLKGITTPQSTACIMQKCWWFWYNSAKWRSKSLVTFSEFCKISILN